MGQGGSVGGAPRSGHALRVGQRRPRRVLRLRGQLRDRPVRRSRPAGQALRRDRLRHLGLDEVHAQPAPRRLPLPGRRRRPDEPHVAGEARAARRGPRVQDAPQHGSVLVLAADDRQAPDVQPELRRRPQRRRTPRRALRLRVEQPGCAPLRLGPEQQRPARQPRRHLHRAAPRSPRATSATSATRNADYNNQTSAEVFQSFGNRGYHSVPYPWKAKTGSGWGGTSPAAPTWKTGTGATSIIGYVAGTYPNGRLFAADAPTTPEAQPSTATNGSFRVPECDPLLERVQVLPPVARLPHRREVPVDLNNSVTSAASKLVGTQAFDCSTVPPPAGLTDDTIAGARPCVVMADAADPNNPDRYAVFYYSSRDLAEPAGRRLRGPGEARRRAAVQPDGPRSHGRRRRRRPHGPRAAHGRHGPHHDAAGWRRNRNHHEYDRERSRPVRGRRERRRRGHPQRRRHASLQRAHLRPEHTTCSRLRPPAFRRGPCRSATSW